MSKISEKADAQLTQGIRAQDMLYDDIVLPALDKGDDAISIAMKEYYGKLNGFDTRAFRQCLTHIRTVVKEENPERFAMYCDQFEAIPKYSNERNNFKEKCMDIVQNVDNAYDKKELVGGLDRKRTNEHNIVIGLFNDLNELADEQGFPRPYIHDKKKFDRTSPLDREFVAKITERQEPLFDTINHLMAEENTYGSVIDKMKTMNVKELSEFYQKLNAKTTFKEDSNNMVR